MDKKNIPPIHVRGDEFYDDVLNALAEKLGKKKSKIVHEALDHFAILVLGQEEVMNLRMYKYFKKQEDASL